MPPHPPLPPTPPSRLGFHYYPDTTHYRESDLRAWLPKLQALGASWLILQTPANRAIPETFLRGLLDNGIEPVLHFPLSLAAPPAAASLTLLLETYARWGVNYICLFDKPNLRAAWAAKSWAQSDLVERFLDLYLPLANEIIAAGLWPVFPPLEPGGDYWDTAFLHTALQALQRRGQEKLLERLALGAYAQAGQQALNWGAGGPARWPGVRPYFTPPDEEDHRGFRIFDWYLAAARAALGRTLPVMLLGVGQQTLEPEKALCIAGLLEGRALEKTDPVPGEVLASAFSLLATAPGDSRAPQAWYALDGSPSPCAAALEGRAPQADLRGGSKQASPGGQPASPPAQPIQHYLLLPRYEWGIADWHLDVIRPFVKKYQPTIGFNPAEAAHARQVTIVGGDETFPPEILTQLRQFGCKVAQIRGDGTSIATQLATK